MELKLQQAIVATRAGRTDIAQSLLTQLIREHPDEANAWFLLGHIVDTPERQTLYLHKTLELEPDHAIARHRLMQLENGPIPAPVFPQQPDAGTQAEVGADEAETIRGPVATTVAAATVVEHSEGLWDPESQQLEPQTTPDQQWTESAGQPIRENHETAAQPADALTSQDSPSPPSETASSDTSGEVWLVRILVIMVIVAAIVLGILVLLILI